MRKISMSSWVFLSKENNANNRGNALLRLEKIAPELSLKKINLCIEALTEIQDIETNPKIVIKINNLIKEYFNLKKSQLSRNALHNVDIPKNKSSNTGNAYNNGNVGFILLVIGLFLMLIAYAMALDNSECAQSALTQGEVEALQDCMEEYNDKLRAISTISLISSLTIFTGIGLMCRAILNNQKPPRLM